MLLSAIKQFDFRIHFFIIFLDDGKRKRIVSPSRSRELSFKIIRKDKKEREDSIRVRPFYKIRCHVSKRQRCFIKESAPAWMNPSTLVALEIGHRSIPVFVSLVFIEPRFNHYRSNVIKPRDCSTFFTINRRTFISRNFFQFRWITSRKTNDLLPQVKRLMWNLRNFRLIFFHSL